MSESQSHFLFRLGPDGSSKNTKKVVGRIFFHFWINAN